MRHHEVNIEHADEVGLSEDSPLDTLPCESLLAETTLDIVENFSMCRVRLVEYSAESEVGRAETVAEALSEDAARVGVRRFLDCMATDTSWRGRFATEEGVFWQAVEQRRLFPPS